MAVSNTYFLVDTPPGTGYVTVLSAVPFEGGNSGGVAQLGERVNGIHEVRGSIPLASMLPLRSRTAPSHGSLRRDGPDTRILSALRE